MAAKNAKKTTGGSTGGGTTATPDYDDLFAAARDSGYPKSFIANNYKKYGFTSSTGLYDEYGDWDDGGAEPEEAAGPGVEAKKFSQDIQTLSNLLSQAYGGGAAYAKASEGVGKKAQALYNELYDKANEEQRQRLNEICAAYGIME